MVTPQTHHDFWSAQSNRREEEEETQSRSFTTNSSAAAVGGLRVAAAASVEGFLRFSGGRLRVLRSKMHNTTSHARVRRLMQKSFFTLHFFFVSSSSLCFCVVVVLASQPPVKVSSSEWASATHSFVSIFIHRDLKGFKCMTVSLDFLESLRYFSRLFETFRFNILLLFKHSQFLE